MNVLMFEVEVFKLRVKPGGVGSRSLWPRPHLRIFQFIRYSILPTFVNLAAFHYYDHVHVIHT